MRTLASFIPHLDWERGFVYFIEDNGGVAQTIAMEYGKLFNVFQYAGARGKIIDDDAIVVLEPKRWACTGRNFGKAFTDPYQHRTDLGPEVG